MRLIDADALMDNINERIENMTSIGVAVDAAYLWALIYDEINDAPTIEPNELDLDIDYSIEYDKRPDGISNAKVTITRIKPRNIIACEKVDELDMLERMYTEPSGDLISRQWLLDLYDIDTTDFKKPANVPLEVIKQNIKDAPSVSAEQVTSKLKQPCDSLLKDDSAECKEQKSKLDLISRAEAIDVGNKIVEELSLSSIDWDDLKHWAKELFDALPSADKQKGEWLDEDGDKVEIDDNGITEGSCWCSVCGEWLVASDEYPTKGSFCPNCGADMQPDK